MWLHSVADIQTQPVFRPDTTARTRTQITLSTPGAATRARLQDFIHRRYAETYQADVSHFLPLLLSSASEQEVQAVLGLQPGASGRFFVEQYLSAPIEDIISKVRQQAGTNLPPVIVDRRRVIETGNLASLKGGSQRLFIVLTELLYQAGFDWVCFTATPQVAALLQRLGFAPEILAKADPACLADGGRSWGSYYQNNPSVLVGDVQKARQTLIRNELATRLLQESACELQDAIKVLSTFSRQEDKTHG